MKDENVVTHINEEEIEKIETKKEKVNLKKLFKRFSASIGAVAAFIATNNAIILLGNLGQDKVLRFLQDLETKYRYGTLKPLMEPNQTLASFFHFAGDAVSVSWSTLMAYPALFSMVVASLAALGVTLVINVASKIFVRRKPKSGKVKSEAKIK